jgi:hypothetical protein
MEFFQVGKLCFKVLQKLWEQLTGDYHHRISVRPQRIVAVNRGAWMPVGCSCGMAHGRRIIAGILALNVKPLSNDRHARCASTRSGPRLP